MARSGSMWKDKTWCDSMLTKLPEFRVLFGDPNRSLRTRRTAVATIPAFLADMFGPENVGAIHGALLTAWSAAAIAGPLIITELSERARAGLAPGGSKIHIYDRPLQILACLLATGFLLAILVRPVRPNQEG